MRDAPRHVVPLATTGLREVSPVTTDSAEYEDTPTSVPFRPPAAARDTYVRLTARMSATRGEDAPSAFEGADWVWYPGEGATTGAPPETRYFAREFSLPEGGVESADLAFTADNAATAYVNGDEVGASDDWESAAGVDVTDSLSAGENRLAFEATNAGDSPNPAGLLARLDVVPSDGDRTTVTTGGEWRTTKDAPEGWTRVGFDDGAWPTAAVLGAYGVDPWGEGVSPPAEGTARLRLRDRSGDAASTPAVSVSVGGGTGVRTTGWVAVPADLAAGDATLQIRAAENATTRVSAATLEVAVRPPL